MITKIIRPINPQDMMTNTNNMPLKHEIYGFYNSFINKIKWFNLYRKTYSNFLSVSFNELQNNYPIKAILLNKDTKILKSKDEVALCALLTKHKKITYDEKNDLAIFDISELGHDIKKIKFYGIKQNLDAIMAFDKSIYDDLPLQNKIVVDIGACTGDTPIYFAICGAQKVIALEPYPKNFEMLKKNIIENNLEKSITIKLAGCSSTSSEIIIDPNFESSMRSSLKEFKTGIKIPLIPLENIVNKENLTNAILKLDCEGCEYEVILTANKELLQKFSHIQIEYHSGYKNIKQKLESCGFNVKILTVENSQSGYLLAIKN